LNLYRHPLLKTARSFGRGSSSNQTPQSPPSSDFGAASRLGRKKAPAAVALARSGAPRKDWRTPRCFAHSHAAGKRFASWTDTAALRRFSSGAHGVPIRAGFNRLRFSRRKTFCWFQNAALIF
jgi:hypothetical protein